MLKRTISIAAVLFVLALVMGGPAASAYLLGCQGLDVGLAGGGLGIGSDAALWNVSGAAGRLVSGNLIAMYTNNPGVGGSSALTCQYTLDPSSTTANVNGQVEQTLVWDSLGTNSGGCTNGTPAFTDHVYLNYTGAAAAGMIDDNLEDDGVAGSGSCYLIHP